MKYSILATAFSFFLVGLALFTYPDVSFAQAGGLVPCDGPDCNMCHLASLAEKVIEFIVQIAFVIAALLFAYAGFLFFTGGSDPGQITNARKIFTNTFVGIIIILTAWLVVNVILTTLTGKGVNPFTEILCEVNAIDIRPDPTEGVIGQDKDISKEKKTPGVNVIGADNTVDDFGGLNQQDIEEAEATADEFQVELDEQNRIEDGDINEKTEGSSGYIIDGTAIVTYKSALTGKILTGPATLSARSYNTKQECVEKVAEFTSEVNKRFGNVISIEWSSSSIICVSSN